MLHYHELSIWTTWFFKIPHHHVFFVIPSPYQYFYNELVVAFMTSMGLQLLQGFAGAATPREGR